MITLSEPAIKALRERLESDLAGVVDEINAAQADPHYVLSHPVEVLDYVPPLNVLSQFPTVGIAEGPFRLVDDTGWGATGVGSLSVVVFEVDTDQRALAWKLRRWAQAVSRCVLAGRHLNPGGWGVVLEQVDPGPTLGKEEDPDTVMSMVAVTIQVRSEQDA